ncbi:MAG: alpha/beta hydrolase-fold protein [Planctomycetota bacterium]|nr:alpha/beta hydrolase-fold protein [Planctomycetota bacterium]
MQTSIMQSVFTSGKYKPHSVLPGGRFVVLAAVTVALMAGVFSVSAEAQAGDSKVTAVEQIAPRIKLLSFKSDVLNMEKRFCVVLPDGYSTAADDRPWLVLLHGRGRHERSLVDDPRARAALLAASFVIVLPDGDNGWYIDSPAGRHQEYLAEVLGLAASRFGLSDKPSRRAITGWSMGGYGCTRFVQTHGGPNGDWQFALVAPIIGLLDYPSNPRGFPAGQSYPVRTEAFGKEPGNWPKLNPIRQAGRLRGMSVLLITGDKAFDRTMNERFSRRLTELGIEHDLKVLEGTHSFDVVREALPLVIERTKQVFHTTNNVLPAGKR